MSEGKPKLSLVPYEAQCEIAKVIEKGSEKRGLHEWREGRDWTKEVDAIQRHLGQWNNGEDKDEETGLSHLAHAGARLMMLITYEATNTGKDDRR